MAKRTGAIRLRYLEAGFHTAHKIRCFASMQVPGKQSMKKQSILFSPYGLLFMAIFLEYFPGYFQQPKPNISLGPVHLYIPDIALLWLLGTAGFVYSANGRAV